MRLSVGSSAGWDGGTDEREIEPISRMCGISRSICVDIGLCGRFSMSIFECGLKTWRLVKGMKKGKGKGI